MSDSTARRPFYVYFLAALAFSLFVAHAARTIDSAESVELARAHASDSEVIIITRPNLPELSHLREDLARLREETDKVRFHVEMQREPSAPGRITIRRQ
jgi:hypothetical protein